MALAKGLLPFCETKILSKSDSIFLTKFAGKIFGSAYTTVTHNAGEHFETCGSQSLTTVWGGKAHTKRLSMTAVKAECAGEAHWPATAFDPSL